MIADVSDAIMVLLQTVIVVCGVVLVADIVLTGTFTPRYMWSFYFFIDLFGTLSIILEWPGLVDSVVVLGVTTEVSMLRAVRVSRVTRVIRITKAARTLRLIRLLKMMRVQSFTEAMTNGAVMAVLVLATALPLFSYAETTPMWASAMAATLSQLDPRIYCSEPDWTSFPCANKFEQQLNAWFDACNEYPDAGVDVLYVEALQRTYVNPYVWQGDRLSEIDLIDTVPQQESNVVTIAANFTQHVTVVTDMTLVTQVDAVLEVVQVVVLIAVIYWLAVFIRGMTVRFVMGPLSVILNAVDDIFPGTFPGEEKLQIQPRLRNVGHRRKVSV